MICFFRELKALGLRCCMGLRSGLRSFLECLYPPLCQLCDRALACQENHLCFSCRYRLPLSAAPISSLLAVGDQGQQAVWRLHHAFCFTPGGTVQRLLHRFKYKRQVGLGKALAHIWSSELAPFLKGAPIDIVVPVPLHKGKESVRGYNQSYVLAKEIADIFGLACNGRVLRRERSGASQTGFGKRRRKDNVKHAFRLSGFVSVKGMHVLLIDDVFTTGATLEACSWALLAGGAAKVSLATFCVTMR